MNEVIDREVVTQNDWEKDSQNTGKRVFNVYKERAILSEIAAVSAMSTKLLKIKYALESEDSSLSEKILQLHGHKPMTCYDLAVKRNLQLASFLRDKNGMERSRVMLLFTYDELDSLLDVLVDVFFLSECDMNYVKSVWWFDKVNKSLPKQEQVLSALSTAAVSLGFTATTPILPQFKFLLKSKIWCCLEEDSNIVTSTKFVESVKNLKPPVDYIVLNSEEAYMEFAERVARAILKNPDLLSVERAKRIQELFDRVVLTNVWKPKYHAKSELFLATMIYCAELSDENYVTDKYAAKRVAKRLINFVENNSILMQYKQASLTGQENLENTNNVILQ